MKLQIETSKILARKYAGSNITRAASMLIVTASILIRGILVHRGRIFSCRRNDWRHL